MNCSAMGILTDDQCISGIMFGRHMVLTMIAPSLTLKQTNNNSEQQLQELERTVSHFR